MQGAEKNNLQLIMWQDRGIETRDPWPRRLCKILSTGQVMSRLFPSSESEQILSQQAQTHHNPKSTHCTEFSNKPHVKTQAVSSWITVCHGESNIRIWCVKRSKVGLWMQGWFYSRWKRRCEKGPFGSTIVQCKHQKHFAFTVLSFSCNSDVTVIYRERPENKSQTIKTTDLKSTCQKQNNLLAKRYWTRIVSLSTHVYKKPFLT